MANNMASNDYDKINPNLGFDMGDEQGDYLPSLQVTKYQPSMGDEVFYCLSEDTWGILGEAARKQLGGEKIDCFYKKGREARDPVVMHKLPKGLRMVVLAIPKIFIMDKKTKEVDHWRKGVKLSGTDNMTAAKLTVALVVGGDVVRDDAGGVELFHLKLTSTKTGLIGGDRRDKTIRCLKDVNKGLLTHFGKRKESLMHLVSLNISPEPYIFSNGDASESSNGIFYTLVGNAKPLTVPVQEEMLALLNDPSIIEMIKDPFGVESGGNASAVAAASTEAAGAPWDDEAEPDDIPFG